MAGRKKTRKTKAQTQRDEKLKQRKEEAIQKKKAINPDNGMSFDAFCSIRKIQSEHRPGMKAFKEASKKKLKLKEWDLFFKDY